MKNHAESQVVVATKNRGRGFAAKIAINAIGGDVKFARHILRQTIIYIGQVISLSLMESKRSVPYRSRVGNRMEQGMNCVKFITSIILIP
jgi:hypothetical protein